MDRKETQIRTAADEGEHGFRLIDGPANREFLFALKQSATFEISSTHQFVLINLRFRQPTPGAQPLRQRNMPLRNMKCLRVVQRRLPDVKPPAGPAGPASTNTHLAQNPEPHAHPFAVPGWRDAPALAHRHEHHRPSLSSRMISASVFKPKVLARSQAFRCETPAILSTHWVLPSSSCTFTGTLRLSFQPLSSLLRYCCLGMSVMPDLYRFATKQPFKTTRYRDIKALRVRW